MADVALWLGPYMSISSPNASFVQGPKRSDKCRQITIKPNNTHRHTAKTTRKSPSQICVSSRETANQTNKRGKSPNNKHPPKKICHGTQRSSPLRHAQKHAKNELSTTTFSETWKSKHSCLAFVGIDVKNCTRSRAYKIRRSQRPLRCACTEGHNL